MDSTRQFTAAEQAYYSQLDEDVTTGRIGTVRRGTPRDGSRISDDELDAILRGRPGLGRDHATGTGRSPRRQVRLPESTNDALRYLEVGVSVDGTGRRTIFHAMEVTDLYRHLVPPSER